MRGRGDLFSELEERLNKRKNQSESQHFLKFLFFLLLISDDFPLINIFQLNLFIYLGDNNANGSNGSVRRPWEKPSVPSLNGGTVNNDSPKTHRK